MIIRDKAVGVVNIPTAFVSPGVEKFGHPAQNKLKVNCSILNFSTG